MNNPNIDQKIKSLPTIWRIVFTILTLILILASTYDYDVLYLLGLIICIFIIYHWSGNDRIKWFSFLFMQIISLSFFIFIIGVVFFDKPIEKCDIISIRKIIKCNTYNLQYSNEYEIKLKIMCDIYIKKLEEYRRIYSNDKDVLYCIDQGILEIKGFKSIIKNIPEDGIKKEIEPFEIRLKDWFNGNCNNENKIKGDLEMFMQEIKKLSNI